MDSPSGIAVRPAKGLGLAVVEPDIGHQFAHQVGDGAEDAPTDAFTGDHAQPDLHLIQPGRIGGREMELHLGVALQPGSHRRRLMRREVIKDQMNLFSPLADYRLIQEAHELFAGVTGHAAALNFAGLDFQGGRQRHRPVLHVLHAVPFRLPGAQRQGRLGAIQGLDGGFLVHAEDRSFLWRIQVQAQDIFGLGLKIRIGAE